MQKHGFATMLERLKNPGDLVTWAEKPIVSFNKFLWPSRVVISAKAGTQGSSHGSQGTTLKNTAGPEDDKDTPRKIAFLGLTDCDARALNIFLDQFAHTDIMPKRSQILIMSVECKPTESCFCQAIDYKNFASSDLHVQDEGKKYQIFALTKTGEKILSACGIEKFDKNIVIRPIKPQSAKKIDLPKLSRTLDDKTGHIEFWQKIANECFGCGACTAVCPLCFCFRQNEENQIDGSCHQCLKSDSCYSASFSELSGHHNIRPKNTDRMYNWYHHKFCRSMKKNEYPLCTGCGRCIDTCPAHLNQQGIVNGIQNEVSEKMNDE